MDYYARVFAFNSIGYSLPQSADFPQKPMVVPSAPSSVTLERVSSTELQVIFNQPSDNGGDYITEYIVEWDTSPDFNTNMQSAKVTYLAGGAPFFKTISGLTTGVYYYVRVAAYNSQGYGAYQTSTPAALNPATKPSVPTNVQLGVTSDSLLTVSFDEPLNNGGDTISNYLIEWDVSASFNSVSTLPNKGSVTISASSDSSYTIQLLTANTKYYARVSAINSVGYGIPQLASPNYAYPSKQVPGKPHTILASTGASVGEIDIAWQRPRVPHHGIQCSGTTAAPADCPVAFGDTLPASDGGSTIIEYEIEYNERSDFLGSDGGIETASSSPYIINGLTPGRTYFVRILARNAVGSGASCANGGALCTTGVLSATAAE
jgi:titin